MQVKGIYGKLLTKRRLQVESVIVKMLNKERAKMVLLGGGVKLLL
jgi:hypothetical protein